MPTLTSPRHLAPLHGLLLSFSLAATRAHAQPGSVCSDPRVQVEGKLAARWLEPVVDLCGSLATMNDVDPSAQLRVVAAGEDVILEATLGDGRSTLRRLRAPSELPLTVEALVAMPPEVPAEPAQPAPPAAPAIAVAPVAPPPVAPVVAPREDTLVLERKTEHAPRRFGLEFGLYAASRIAGPTHYVSIGISGYAGVRSGPWLLTLNGRYDGYQTVLEHRPRQFEMTTAGGGFSLWRELLVRGHNAFEAGLTTWLLGETQAYTPVSRELAFSSFDPRLALMTRWVTGTAPMRYFVGGDAEMSPNRLRHSPRVDSNLPALPAWSVGLSVGVAWEPQ